MITMFCIGFSLIAEQVVLMRFFSETKHHHIAFFVIGIALLGIGASGTLLTLLHRTVSLRMELWIGVGLFLFTLATAISIPLIESLPLDFLYFVFDSAQLMYFLLYIFILFLLFFFGGFVSAAMLELFSQDAPLLYGINLVAGGIGGLAPLFLLNWVPSHQLFQAFSLLGILGGVCWILTISSRDRDFVERLWVSSLLVVLVIAFLPWEPKPAYYKPLYTMLKLKEEGLAAKLMEKRSPRGTYQLFESSALHYTPFAGLQASDPPPPQIAILKDGELLGTIFKLSTLEEAKILDTTPQSVPYRIVEHPKVLILDETGGLNFVLARRFNASSITVVVSDPIVADILAEYLQKYSGSAFEEGHMEIISEEPRLFLEQAKMQDRRFDIIHIASTESLPATTSGLLAPRENYLLTAEGVRETLSILTEDGILSVSRGLQSPPRDAFRFLILAKRALQQRGIKDPENYILLARNYLAFLLMVGIVPVSTQRKQRFLDLLPALGMDPEYYPDIRIEKHLPYLNRVEGPPGQLYSYYHWGAETILEKDPQVLIDQWVYDVSPVTDQRPYFHNFFTWKGLGQIFSQLGSDAVRKAELGYLIVVITGVCMGIIAFPLLLVAVVLGGGRRTPSAGRLYAVIYFFCIGVAFLFLEISWLAFFRRIVGDPFLTVTIVFTGLLVSAGIGSMRIGKAGSHLEIITLKAAFKILLILFLYETVVPFLMFPLAQTPSIVRYSIALVMVSIPGYWMGVFFPIGLRMVQRHGQSLVPLAWASNGFASVISSPIAQMLSMSAGFHWLFILAGIFYIIAALYTFFYQVIKGILVEKRSP